MKVVANTHDGVLIEATSDEVRCILKSVTGNDFKVLAIGQKIPAIDYAASILKVKELKKNYAFNEIKNYLRRFNESFGNLSEAIDAASDVEI